VAGIWKVEIGVEQNKFQKSEVKIKGDLVMVEQQTKHRIKKQAIALAYILGKLGVVKLILQWVLFWVFLQWMFYDGFSNSLGSAIFRDRQGEASIHSRRPNPLVSHSSPLEERSLRLAG
jgi:hypothetical protein